jgi:hypothetical protein
MWRAADPWPDVLDALLSQMSHLQLDCMEAQAASVALRVRLGRKCRRARWTCSKLKRCPSAETGVSFGMARRPPPPIATLGQLHREQPRWFWAHCGRCRRSRALPLAPFVIRWGPEALSDMLRRNLTCTACGHRGASLQLRDASHLARTLRVTRKPPRIHGDAQILVPIWNTV